MLTNASETYERTELRNATHEIISPERQALKEERKERKRRKRREKALDKIEGNTKGNSAINSEIPKCQTDRFANSDFPSLEQGVRSRVANKKSDTNDVREPSKKDNNSFTVDLETLLKANKQPKQIYIKQEKISYSGNPLDSSKPQRMYGKHKEGPKVKKTTKLKEGILKDEQTNSTPYDYCDNEITENLDRKVVDFLGKVVNFQEKAFKKDPVKAKIKKRYVVGFHEVKKYLLANRVKIIIFPSDLKVVQNGALDSTIEDLKIKAEEHNAIYVFALTRRQLGKLTKKFLPISCVGVLSHESVDVGELMAEIRLTKRVQEETLEIPNDTIIENLTAKIKLN